MADLPDLVDLAGKLRYGVGTNEKEALAARGSLPGSPADSSPYKDNANRYAAGYLFGQQYPEAAPTAMPVVSWLRALFGDSPELQAQAVAGMNRGITEHRKTRASSKSPALGSFLKGAGIGTSIGAQQ